jgi:hypothetical protein
LAVVTNAVGEKVSHADVVRTAGETAATLGKLIERMATRLGRREGGE